MRALRALPAPLLALIAATVHATNLVRDNTETDSPPNELLIEHTGGPETCTRPARSGDTIAVNYKGMLLSTGEEFDESYKRGKPFIFVLGSGMVIQGWEEGLVGMCMGESRKLTIPSDMAYGDFGSGIIPPKATLVFETRLEDIVGVSEEENTTPVSSASPSQTSEQSLTIATAPSTTQDDSVQDHTVDEVGAGPESSPDDSASPQTECKLLGPFALLVQGALGALALLTLVWKRWCEVPKRPWKIFIFDVSKQVLGSMLTHVINLAMSMLSSADTANAVAHVVSTGGSRFEDSDGRIPNPCSFYLLNLGIDTTIGVPVLYILLKILFALFAMTPLARPPESLQTGNYGQPPKASWYGKQLLIYCIGLIGMKIFVFFLFLALPWLPWVGDWALRWTAGNEALEIAFAVFIFPLAMNAIQYWIIDSFIMDKKKSNHQYEQVTEADDADDERQRMINDDSDADADADETIHGKDASVLIKEAPVQASNPTPLPVYRVNVDRGESSHGSTSPQEDDGNPISP